MLTLYNAPYSHYTQKVRRILAYKKIPFESRIVPYHDKRELLSATGQDYTPAIVDGERVVLWDEVPDFLERLVPEPTIYPDGTRDLARIVEDWAHARLEELVWRVVVPDVPATFTDEHERWVFEEIQTIKRGPLEALRARRPEFAADLDRQLAALEGRLAGGGWLLGARPSLADFAVYGALFPLEFAGQALPERFAALSRWYRAVAAM